MRLYDIADGLGFRVRDYVRPLEQVHAKGLSLHRLEP